MPFEYKEFSVDPETGDLKFRDQCVPIYSKDRRGDKRFQPQGYIDLVSLFIENAGVPFTKISLAKQLGVAENTVRTRLDHIRGCLCFLPLAPSVYGDSLIISDIIMKGRKYRTEKLSLNTDLLDALAENRPLDDVRTEREKVFSLEL